MPAASTFSTLNTDLQNNIIRRQNVEYVAYLPTLLNTAMYEICQRKKYWFLEVRQQFAIIYGVGSWWQIALPAGAAYGTIQEDIEGVWEVLTTGQNRPLDYLPYDQAISLYYLPTSNPANSPQGQVESYSETTDYTGILLFPVPIQSTTILVEWRAKSLPDWDGVSTTATNILIQQYYNVVVQKCKALSYDFFGMNQRWQIEDAKFDKLCKETIDREHVSKRWQRIKTLPQRKGLEIPREAQIAPFNTPPWTL